MKKTTILFSLIIFLAACHTAKVDTSNVTPKVIQLKSPFSVAETSQKIVDYLNGKKVFTVKVINHTKSAKKVGMTLTPTQLIIFGNPKMGTLLMQENPQIGQELPLKTLVYTKDGQTYVEFKNMSYLKSMYHIEDKKGVTTKMNGLLGSFSKLLVK